MHDVEYEKGKKTTAKIIFLLQKESKQYKKLKFQFFINKLIYNILFGENTNNMFSPILINFNIIIKVFKGYTWTADWNTLWFWLGMSTNNYIQFK